jgi:hypothetical protein
MQEATLKLDWFIHKPVTANTPWLVCSPKEFEREAAIADRVGQLVTASIRKRVPVKSVSGFQAFTITLRNPNVRLIGDIVIFVLAMEEQFVMNVGCAKYWTGWKIDDDDNVPLLLTSSSKEYERTPGRVRETAKDKKRQHAANLWSVNKEVAIKF